MDRAVGEETYQVDLNAMMLTSNVIHLFVVTTSTLIKLCDFDMHCLFIYVSFFCMMSAQARHSISIPVSVQLHGTLVIAHRPRIYEYLCNFNSKSSVACEPSNL